MATYGANDALYGTGTFGTARYGRVTPIIAVSGVVGTSAVGTVTPKAEVSLTATGVQSTGSIGTTEQQLNTTATGVSSTEFDRLDGIGSAAVGVSDSVTLTNKTFNFDNNTMQGTLAVDRIPTLSAAKISDVDASGTYPTGDFDLTNDTVYYQVYG